MSHILHIDSSANVAGSISAMLANEFVTAWQAEHPDTTVTYRNFGIAPVPPVDQDWLAGVFSPPGTPLTPEQTDALALSNTLVDELFAADAYVFSIPMYNYGIPSTFKAYIDQIFRAGRTVHYTAGGVEGGLKGKKVVIVSARLGEYGIGSPRHDFDFHKTYLEKILPILGLTDIHYVPVTQNAQHDDEATRFGKLEAARAQLAQIRQLWDSN